MESPEKDTFKLNVVVYGFADLARGMQLPIYSFILEGKETPPNASAGETEPNVEFTSIHAHSVLNWLPTEAWYDHYRLLTND